MANDGNEIRDINSGRPFQQCAQEYLDKGWAGPMPMPPKEKHPPEAGFTGWHAKQVDSKQMLAWLADKSKLHSNIALHLGAVTVRGEDLEVIGIDVDDYEDGVDQDGNQKIKRGFAELRRLERKYGKLPATWTSSARGDGKSGIRFFLVPAGYHWRGKASGGDSAIEIIQAGHRYAMVYPSWHPKGGQYLWYRPGTFPNGQPDIGIDAVNVVGTDGSGGNGSGGGLSDRNLIRFVPREPVLIPSADLLPKLPDKWIAYLTSEYMPATDRPIDMDSSVDDLLKWADKTFRRMKRGSSLAEHGGCSAMLGQVEEWKEQIASDATSHDKIIGAHWNLMSMGLEGHAGWKRGLREVERVWIADVKNRGKRSLTELKLEIFRSRANALRKLKASVAESEGRGIRTTGAVCGCFDPEAMGLGEDGPFPTGKADDPGDYERNDDGNAEHLLDLYEDNLKFVDGYGHWIFWNGERWIKDGDGLARRCYRVVKDRQLSYAKQLWIVAQSVLDRTGDASRGSEYERAKAKAKTFSDWADSSGTNLRAENALKAARTYEGVTIKSDSIDGNIHLLGVENGVVELKPTGIFFRQATREDMIITNTGVRYRPVQEQLQEGGAAREGVQLWQEYLELFLPDIELREFFQRAMGYCLFGRNTEKYGIFLYGEKDTGKSTALNVIMSAMGEYASPVEMAIFREKDLNPGLAQALPRRIVTTTEAGAQNHLHADMFKRITGNDPMTAELKGVNTIIRRIPAFVPVIATNSSPNIRGADAALTRRLLIIPFDMQVTPALDKKQGGADLSEKSREAILAWLVDGWIMYASKGLDRSSWPAMVRESTSEFAHGLNDIGEFLADWTEQTGDENDMVLPVRLHEAFYQWATIYQKMPENKVYSLMEFGKRMREQGFKSKNVWDKKTKKSPRLYVGIKLKESGQNIVSGKFKPGTQ